MPTGIPVATVAINGAANAGILAAKMLATSDPALLERLKAYSEKLKNQVVAKADKLDEIGYEAYLKQIDIDKSSIGKYNVNKGNRK